MSARPAIFYTNVFFILLPIYFWIQPSVKPVSALEEKQESLLKLSGIDAITIASGTESLRFQKSKDGSFYEVVAPPGQFIPRDLMDAMVSIVGADNRGARPTAADQDSLWQRKPHAHRHLCANRGNPESLPARREHGILPIPDVPVDRRQARQERVALFRRLPSLCHSEPRRRRISTDAPASVVNSDALTRVAKPEPASLARSCPRSFLPSPAPVVRMT